MVERELEVVEVARVEDELVVVVDDSVVLEGVVVGVVDVVDALEDISELDWMLEVVGGRLLEVVDSRLLEVLEPAGVITRAYTPAAAAMITMTITAIRAVLTPL